MIAATVETFGQLDILVNNAGIIALGNIVDTTLESWRLVNSVNSDGVFLGCKHAIPEMAQIGGWFYHQHVIGGSHPRPVVCGSLYRQ